MIVDDVTEPDASLYQRIDLLYSLRSPSELVPHMKRLADSASVDLLVKPLASEHPGWPAIRYGDSTFFLWTCL